MKVWNTWDARERVLTLYTEGCVLTDRASTAEWAKQLRLQFDGIEGKVLLLICVDGMTIHPEAAPLYGAAAKEIVQEHAVNWARFGAGGSRAIIAVEALNRGVAPHLFDTRESALAYLRKASKPAQSLPSELRRK